MQTTEVRDTERVAVTPVRTLRIGKPWDDAQERAAALGEKLPDVIRLCLAAYNVDPTATTTALLSIRGNAPVEQAGEEG